MGKGSTFFFEITFKKWKKEEDIKNLLGKITFKDFYNQDKMILLAEDNTVNQLLVVNLLNKWKIGVETADNGQEALDMLNKKKYDLILMDVQMPKMDGYQTTEYIRNLHDETLKNTPIIAMTASAFKDDIDKCISIGMNDFISKPFKKETLYHKISLLLK